MEHVDFIRHSSFEVRISESSGPDTFVEIIRVWEGAACSAQLVNHTSHPVGVKEIVLFKGEWKFTGNTKFYGEGYNMLSQYGGTIENPILLGGYDDRLHYKLPSTEGFYSVYNFAILSPESSEHYLFGFSSCHRFSGELRLGDGYFEIVLDGENRVIHPGETWELEEFVAITGNSREDLLDCFSKIIQINHPRLPVKEIPTGWCSWYCFGPDVNEQNIFDNLSVISASMPGLKYVQIDDGYQSCMGDWLIAGKSFSDMGRLCREIKEQGFEPAIWVAPFIVEKDSILFKNNSEWLIRDELGEPLPSDRFSFGGWRKGPWYMLDGTNPNARKYLIEVFQTMRQEWGCKYFKLDANMWGALPGGNRFNENATKIEAYRMGMEAVLEGAGTDSFILGCNAPMWPSLGLVHGMRVTGDISRSWPKIKMLAREGFSRNWQNNRLWINDPDCLVLENVDIQLIEPDGGIRHSSSKITPDEFMFHTAYMMASGGMVLSGDHLVTMSEENRVLLKKILKGPRIAAKFEDDTYVVGRIDDGNRQILCLFNWGDEALTIEIALDGAYWVSDYCTDQKLGYFENTIVIEDMPPHYGKVLICKS